MRNIYLFCVVFLYTYFSSSSLVAQDIAGQHEIKNSNYFKVEFAAVGASVNLAANKTGANANLLSSQSDVGIATTLFRVTHLFSPKLGWYAGVNMNLFKENKSPYYNASFSDIMGEFGMSLFYGGYVPSPLVDVGLVYRIEKNKWDINPRLGFGYGSVLLDRDSDKRQKLVDGSSERSLYKQRAAAAMLNLGIGANYFFGKRSFIAFNATIQQPLEKSYAELTLFTNDVKTDYKKYSSSSIGRDLNLTVGYGFIFGKRKVPN